MHAITQQSQSQNQRISVSDIPLPSILVEVDSTRIISSNRAFSDLFPSIGTGQILLNLQNSSARTADQLIQAIRKAFHSKNPVIIDRLFLHTGSGDREFTLYARVSDSDDLAVALVNLVPQMVPGHNDLFEFSPVMQLLLDQKGNIVDANRQWLLTTGYSRKDIESLEISSFINKESVELIQNEIIPSLKSDQATEIHELDLRMASGEKTRYQVQFNLVPSDNSLLMAFMGQICHSASADDMNEMALANALRDSLEALTSTLNFDEVLDRILVNVGSVVPNEAANVMMIWSGVAYIVRSIGYAELGLEETMMSLQIPIVQESHFLSMYETGMPLAVGDLQGYVGIESQSSMHWARSMASAPLRSKGQVFGFLNLESSQAGFYNQRHAERLQAFADQAAVAIENARLYAEVQQYAITDELTDIYNRRGLFELGRREVERARRYGRSLSAVMIDTDEFKSINDTYSHSVGDHVLRSMADRWKSSIREVDILGRYGGDEFVILLPETDLANALQVADRLRIAISGKKIETPIGDLDLTVSVGVADIDDDTTTFDALIEKADQAMFQAKTNGKNQVKSYYV
ncbi:diguanylate cyclase [Leptolinea tardivitalis]|uniref:GGDEF domain-containing protein n=1 Tax=Leptolinea tardivitalis TaxID=229920 RepID=A0A0P6XH74_9CHLR|nr:diguanylate cyclase [Leptolinea tardivitalis]KPL70456.1 hypothetical protein ADM99_15065 [Leptolinea tardivitalis]GAP22042.1 protein containing PAS domain S-box [Leptolinea tardivitalis]